MTHFKLFLFTTALLLISTLFLSCSKTEADTSSSEPYIVVLTATDYAFGMPAKIKSGWVTFRMENMGEKDHNAIIKQSTSGLSIGEIRAKLDSGESFPMSLVGGPGLQSPDHKSDITINLEPGNYVMFCTVLTKDGEYHADLGMQMAFQVTDKSSGATIPKADTRIILNKYDIRRTKTFAAGKQTVEIVHKGFPYGLHLFHVQDSLSIEKAELQMDGKKGEGQVQWISGAEPSDSARSTFISYSFSPGEYAWTSHAYVWGVKDRFEVEKGERLNKLIEQEKEGKANMVGINVEDKEIQINNNIQAGRNTFYYINQENDTHLIQIDMLKKGESKKNILDFYELAQEDRYDTSLPWRGWGIRINEEDSVTVELQPGKYLITCHARSENGVKHRDQGETAEFVVE